LSVAVEIDTVAVECVILNAAADDDDDEVANVTFVVMLRSFDDANYQYAETMLLLSLFANINCSYYPLSVAIQGSNKQQTDETLWIIKKAKQF
jgi:hypothetical protein